VEIGLNPNDRVLDVGCGAGRVGIWLIGFLHADRYFGVDSHLDSLRAFAEYELPLNGLQDKRPQLSHDSNFNVAKFSVKFDFVLDLYVSPHLTPDLALRLYANVVDVLAPNGRIVIPHAPTISPSQMRDLRLRIERTDRRPTFLLAQSKLDYIKEEAFHVLHVADVSGECF